jgi:hypothetical protein
MEDLLDSYESGAGDGSSSVVTPIDGGVSLTDPVIVDIYSGIGEVISLLELMNPKSSVNLNDSIDSMEDKLDANARQQEDMSSLIKKMKVEIEMANNKIISTGESLIFAYGAIEIKEKKIDENLALLESQLKVLKVQKYLGYVTTIDEDGLKLSVADLNYTKETLNLEKENIKRKLNLLLSQPYDTSLDIVFTPLIVSSKIEFNG